jgi:hypothetical protein
MGARMARTSIAVTVLIGALLGSLPGCSSRSDSAPSASVPSSTSAPTSGWLAVIASAADPNDLDARRADVVTGLGSDDGHVVVSPGACFTGIPQRYGALYVLAVTDPSRSWVEDRLRVTGVDTEWVGAVTSTCLD